MKIVIIASLIILVCYFVWRFVIAGDALVLVTKGGGKRVTAVLKEIETNKAIIIEIDNDSAKNKIDSFDLPKPLASQLGITPPQGFREESLPLSKGEEKNKEMADFVDKYNKENVRFVGELQLTPNEKTLLPIPVKDTTKMDGQISFMYSAKLGLGGTISHFRVDLSNAPTANKR